jgi:acyl carrier protein
MGLDAVELITAVEASFGLGIADRAAAQLITVGTCMGK